MGPIERVRRYRAVRRHLELRRDALYRLAYTWCNDSHLADDLVQQTAARALQSAGQLRAVDQVERWIVRILANCWHDHLRRSGRDTREEEATHPQVETATPELELERDATVSRVRAAMMRVTPEQRQVITLVDLEGYTYAEAAEVLGVPIGTVMSRLCRGRRLLRQILLSDIRDRNEGVSTGSRVHAAMIRRIK